MKYAIFSDDFLSYFRLDDNGETLVLTDKRGYTRAVTLLPYEVPYEERMKGEWIKCGWSIRCSICNYDMPYSVRNFCPNCGADMRGDQECGNVKK